MSLVLALFLAINMARATPDYSAGPPAQRPVAFGIVSGIGSKSVQGVARAPASDLFTMETRFFLSRRTSVDLRVDLVRLWLYHALAGQQRLPVIISYHYRLPFGRGGALGMAAGLDSALGWDAIARDNQLAYRPAGTLASSFQVGLETLSDGLRLDWGLFVRGTVGAVFSAQPTLPVSRVLLEMTFTWNPANGAEG